MIGEYVFFTREDNRGYIYTSAGVIVAAMETEKGGYVRYQMADLFDGRLVYHRYDRIRLAVKGVSDVYGDLTLIATPDKKAYVFLDKKGIPHNPSIKATNIGQAKFPKYFFHGLACENKEQLFDYVKEYGKESEKMDAIFNLNAA